MGRVAFYHTSSSVKRWWIPEHANAQVKEGATVGNDASTASANTSKLNRQVVSDFYRARPVVNKRIHIVGLESKGRFIAHTLRQLPNPPPVTLIFHGWQSLNDWKASRQNIRVVKDGDAERVGGFDVELAFARPRRHGQEFRYEGWTPSTTISDPNVQEGESTEPISSLIVCTRTTGVLQMLSPLKRRLNKDSVILFLQNGMGTIDEVNREIFPDPETRPRYMVGVNTHVVRSDLDDPFGVVHGRLGTISLGLLPQERFRRASPTNANRSSQGAETFVQSDQAEDPDPPTSTRQPTTFSFTPNDRYLLRTLLRAPVLCATGFSPTDVLQMQLEKLAVNSIIGPLTVMLDSRNGSLLYDYHLTRTMRLLLAEISLVIRSLPELQHIPNVSQRFDSGRLESVVIGTASRSSDSISSMLDDSRRGYQTEVDYFNGWIVKKGEELGLRCLMNYMMVNLVKGKQNLIGREIFEDIPQLEADGRESGINIKGNVIAEDQHHKKEV